MPAARIDDPSWPTVVTVGSANFESLPNDKPATLAKLLGVVRAAARQGCDLAVFPELAIGGCEACPDCARDHRPCARHLAQAETAPGPTSDAVAKLARELGIHVIYGFEERDADDPSILYNAAALVTPDGLLGTYRKLHLGIPLETDRFTRGNALPVFETRLGPIGIQICYDFYCGPELSRLLCLKGARLLVNPTGRSALPRAAENLMHATLMRAQENLVYAVSANLVGPHGESRWAGGSVIGGPAFPGFAQVRAQAGDREELIVAPLSFAHLAAWYDWLPWRDWRLGAQLPVTELVAREFEALAAKAR